MSVGKRLHASRELALRVLFQVDLAGMAPEEALDFAVEDMTDSYQETVVANLRRCAIYRAAESGPEGAEALRLHLEQCPQCRRMQKALAFPEMVAHARTLVLGCLQHREQLDATIESHARGWTITRMASVDRNILRLAAYELLFTPDVATSIVVDEAVELAKKYSTAESGRFVNGILGGLSRGREQEPDA